MITFFRRFFQSKVGIAVTLGFLGLIAFAFASSDVANTGTFGGVSGGDRVAVVGDDKISTSELASAANSAVNNARRQNPTISMPAFVEQGGLENVLTEMLERAAISEFAEKYGLRAGTNLVNSEIINIPAFRGADGNFDDTAYRQVLAQQGLTDALVRDDLRSGLLARQLLVPGAFGGRVPEKFTMRYASLLKERRDGAIAIIPSRVFVPSEDPSSEQLQTYYEANRGDYIRPERRIIRYFTFGDDALGELSAPSDEEIAARYEENNDAYAPSENRTVTQLIVPTQQAADAIRERVQAGGSLEAAASEAGLQTVALGPVTQSELTAQTSSAVAQSVFDAGRGEIAEAARSGLGFHVTRVDAIDRKAGVNLEQARGEISVALAEEKRRGALADLAELIEEQAESGVSLPDIASENGIEPSSTKPVTGAGQVYGTQETVDRILAPALQTAFQMEEGEPQLAVLVPGQMFLVYEVTEITQSASAPLAEIRENVVIAWKLAEGSKLAKDASDRVMKRVREGATLDAAIQDEEKTIPGAERINLTREQLGQGQQVPAPLALMFSMAEGTTKRLEAPGSAGWVVVRLNDIEAGTISKEDPQFLQAQQDLNQSISREYGDQLRRAVQAEIGVERNEDAIEAVRKQLTGEI